MNRFGQKIKDLRLHADMSQNELAERIGVERPTLSRIETGIYPPSEIRFSWIKNLAQLFDIPQNELTSSLVEDMKYRRGVA